MNRLLVSMFAACAAALLLACPGPGGNNPTQPTAGRIQGRAMDQAGNPLVDAEISIYGTATNSGERIRLRPHTDAQGWYSVEVPDGNYEVDATYPLTYDGKRFFFVLDPASGKEVGSLPSASGIAADFVLKVGGLRAGEAPGSNDATAYYGAEVGVSIEDVRTESFTTNHFATEFPQGFTVEVTFTPEGPLADGSSGQVLTSTATVKSKYEASWTKIDVPVGRYVVTGKLTRPDGTSKALQVIATGRGTTHAPTSSGVLTFEPDDISGGAKMAYVWFVYGSPYPPMP